MSQKINPYFIGGLESLLNMICKIVTSFHKRQAKVYIQSMSQKINPYFIGGLESLLNMI